MMKPIQTIFIDPSYPIFNGDKLFDLSDVALNRDDQLLPFHRLREELSTEGINIHTADKLSLRSTNLQEKCEYISIGILQNYRQIAREGNLRLKAFVIMEPPVVAPNLYQALPELTTFFDVVYVHNVEGNGYALEGLQLKKLQKFYWPLPYENVIERYWKEQDRAKRIVIINGSHKPRSFNQELYSARIEVMAALAPMEAVDLYGRGWDQWWSSEARWIPYWRNRAMIMSIYKGPCISKYEILGRYQFCLCFENMRMKGYITEKIFDCLYAGTIPLYLGAPDINKYIPENVFIDCSKFESWEEMWSKIKEMTPSQIMDMRSAGKDFLEGPLAKPFFDSLKRVARGCN